MMKHDAAIVTHTTMLPYNQHSSLPEMVRTLVKGLMSAGGIHGDDRYSYSKFSGHTVLRAWPAMDTC